MNGFQKRVRLFIDIIGYNAHVASASEDAVHFTKPLYPPGEKQMQKKMHAMQKKEICEILL